MNKETLEKYLILREVNGVSQGWLEKIRLWLSEYLESIDYKISETSTLRYCAESKNRHSIIFYRKKVYQIRKFLEYLDCKWALNIRPPQEPITVPKRVTREDIEQTFAYFSGHTYELQFKALISLGCDSGMRAQEIYQLEQDDIDLSNRTVYIKHEPWNGKTTKTGQSRVSFFTERTAQIIREYLTYFNNGSTLKSLFSKTHVERAMSKAPIRCKDLRKYFSSEWERRNGNHQVKERLMGHSLKSVDARHYSYLDDQELKKVYSIVMN